MIHSPGRIQLQANLLTMERETSAIFCDYSVSSKNSENLGIIPSAVYAASTKISLINPQRTPHPGVMFRKTAVLDSNGYLNSDFPTEDYALWIRMSRFSNLMSVPELLLNYRISPLGISISSKKSMVAKTLKLRSALISELNLHDYLMQAEIILEEYDKLSLSSERKLLFVRDLLTLASHTSVPKNLARKDILRIAHKYLSVNQILTAAGKISFYKGKRKFIKKISTI